MPGHTCYCLYGDYSAWHFQRLFQAILGDTVADYIRRRRLTRALLDLTQTDHRILDIALDYQFESQESFTRAFKSLFGITPGECRKRGCQSFAILSKPRVTTEYNDHLERRVSMTPNIVDVEKFKVVGMEARFISILSPDRTNDVVIPKLWTDYLNRANEIQNRVGREEVGLVWCLEDEAKSHPNECLYMCAAKVSSSDDVPSGMTAREISGGKYAVFKQKGGPNKFEYTMKYIYSSWFPKSGFVFDDRPEMEIYSTGYEEDSEASEAEIYIPIK